MDEQTDEGAQQAFRHYWHTVVYAYQTGNHRALEQLQTENCQYCDDVVADVKAIHQEKRYWGPTSIEDYSVDIHERGEGYTAIGYGFYVTEHEGVEQGEVEVVVVPRKGYAAVGEMVWVNGYWKVRYVEFSGE